MALLNSDESELTLLSLRNGGLDAFQCGNEGLMVGPQLKGVALAKMFIMFDGRKCG